MTYGYRYGADVTTAFGGLRVVDLSDRLSGAWAARLFGDMAADVVLAEPPDGHPLRREPPFLDEPTGGPIVAKESHFYMVDGEITVAMSKMRKGETWGTALGGRGQVDPFTRQEIQRELMIERFQEEHPGFDFRSAEFNGQVPDPR